MTTRTDTQAIQAKAEEARGWFFFAEPRWVTIEGHKGNKYGPDKPQWIVDLCREAHGHMFPDDIKYEYIVEALDAIIEASEGEDLHDMVNMGYYLEPDLYTHDLLKWVASGGRTGYVSDAIKSYFDTSDTAPNLDELLIAGQRAEREEVYQSVLTSLEQEASA